MGQIVADFITTGVLNGALIKAKSIEAESLNVSLKEKIESSLGNKEVTSIVESAIKQSKEEIELSISNTYETKSNVETKISNSATSTLTSAKGYTDTTKSELNTAINKKANSTDVYTKTQTYTKTETDSAIKLSKESIEIGISEAIEEVATTINGKIDAIQIGGTNLIKKKSGYTLGYLSSSTGSAVNGSNAPQDFYTNDYTYLEKGKTIIFKSHKKQNITPTMAGDVYIHIYNTSKTWTKCAYKTTTANSEAMVSYTATENCYIRFSAKGFSDYNHMAEISTIPSAWSPAPEDIDTSIQSVSNSLQSFENTVNGTFKDGIVEQAEAKAIEQNINILNNEKADIDKEYASIYNNANLSGTAKANLNSAYTSYTSAHTSLISTINTAIADGKTTATEKASVNSTFTTYKGVLATYKQRVQEALDNIGTKKSETSQTNAVTTSKNYTDSQIKLTKESIELGVSETYATKSQLTTSNDNITSLTNRVSSAENKLTKDSLTTTIGNHYTTTSDVNGIVTSKGYQTASQVQQSIDQLQIKFTESGGYNLFLNSKFNNGHGTHWRNQQHNNPQGSCNFLNHTSDWGFPDSGVNTIEYILPVGKSNVEWGVSQQVKVAIGKKYTVSFYYASHRCTSANLIIRQPDSHWLANHAWNPSEYSGGRGSANNWGYKTFTFTAKHEIYQIQIVMNNCSDSSMPGYFWIAKPMCEEGSIASAWSPAPNEVSDGITTIDKDGITVSQSNIDTKTVMNASGFYINKNGQGDVFKVDTNGLAITGKITSNEVIMANGGMYTGQSVRGTNPAGFTLVGSNGSVALRADNGSVYLQPSGDEAKVTAPADPNTFKNLRANNLIANSKVYASGVALTSSIEKKKNIEAYEESALQQILQTKIYRYHLLDDLDEEMKRIGIILQEAPVDAIDIEGVGVDLYQMVTMTWKAIQELKQEITKYEVLEKRIEILDKEIKELKTTL